MRLEFPLAPELTVSDAAAEQLRAMTGETRTSFMQIVEQHLSPEWKKKNAGGCGGCQESLVGSNLVVLEFVCAPHTPCRDLG